MRLKIASLAVSLSILCLVPSATFADTLTLTGTGGTATDGIYVYPYDFTVTTPGGTVTNVAMSCLDFNREIAIGETWAVTSVAIPMGNGTLDGSADINYRADAWLDSLYGNAAFTNSEIQFAIWSIIDPTDIHAGGAYDGFDAISQALATQALVEANVLPANFYANYTLYIPDLSNTSGWTNGVPQAFIVDPPIAATPEPSSLLLFGTGLLGTVAIMRRRMVPALATSR